MKEQLDFLVVIDCTAFPVLWKQDLLKLRWNNFLSAGVSVMREEFYESDSDSTFEFNEFPPRVEVC